MQGRGLTAHQTNAHELKPHIFDNGLHELCQSLVDGGFVESEGSEVIFEIGGAEEGEDDEEEEGEDGEEEDE